MRVWVFGVRPLALGLAAAFVSGCGAQGDGTLPHSASAQSVARSESWIVPGTYGQDLLYASSTSNYVEVFSYPNGTVVGQLIYQGGAHGLCSDRSGNVFIPVWSSRLSTNYIYEYAHGGTEPIATLTDAGVPFGCTVDPTTGNLAVTNVFGLGTGYPPGNVAIYVDAQGAPTYYSDPDITIYGFCAYDDAGNLFVTGQRQGDPIGELPEDSDSFENLSTNLGTYPASLQWNNGELVVGAYDGFKGMENLYRLEISGSSGTVVGKTTLRIKRNKSYLIFDQFWVQGASILGPNFAGRPRGLIPSSWHYPKGGKAVTFFEAPGFRMTTGGGAGVTVSAAPSRSRIR